MAALTLFYRLIVRPLAREPLRTLLTFVAVALGVAVVLAISLAGNAAAGSFHSSMESLAGDSNLEVVAAGGVPEEIVGTLATLPYPLRVRPRLEGLATAVDFERTRAADWARPGGRGRRRRLRRARARVRRFSRFRQSRRRVAQRRFRIEARRAHPAAHQRPRRASIPCSACSKAPARPAASS